jgi:hypothetical protein
MINNDAKSIEAALQSIGAVQFAGALAAQAETARTAFQTLSAEIGQTAVQLEQGLGLNETLKSWAKSWADFLDATNRAAPVTAEAAEDAAKLAQAQEGLATSTEKSTHTFADFIAQGRGFKSTAQETAAATQAMADGMGAQDAAARGLTQQQQALLGQTGEIVTADRAAADATQKVADGLGQMGVATAGATEQQRLLIEQMHGFVTTANAQANAATSLGKALGVIGLDVAELETGMAKADRAVVSAFGEIATSAKLTGEQIGTAFERATDAAKSERAVNALLQAWDQALQEGQITQAQWEAGVQAAGKRLDDLAGIAEKAGAALDRMGKAGKAGFEAIGQGAEYASAEAGKFLTVAERAHARAVALEAFRKGLISAENLGKINSDINADERAGRAATRKGSAGGQPKSQDDWDWTESDWQTPGRGTRPFGNAGVGKSDEELAAMRLDSTSARSSLEAEFSHHPLEVPVKFVVAPGAGSVDVIEAAASARGGRN